ncbi:MAG: hypothetical protein OEO79_16250 [Gemmatimonadota bacterium]|nr:hypothetical protein [Gemmatimonadota bacterium]
MGGLVLGVALLLGSPSPADDPRLYGRVLTTDGTVIEGFLRWDRNEAAFADFIDAVKVVPDSVLREAERVDPAFAAEMRRQRSIVAFGMRLTWDRDDLAGPLRTPSSIVLADVASIEPVDARRIGLTLIDGEAVELFGSTTDLGPTLRGLEIDEGEGEPTVLRWRDVGRVEFLPAPTGRRPTASRLYGTVRTWGGHEFEGFVAWDRDEVLSSDVLDGREDGVQYEIRFDDIESIAPEGRRSARVRLRSGVERVLRGTNDVDQTNRGIEVSVPTLGRVLVPWGDLTEVRFHEPAGPSGDSPPWTGRPGAAIEGTVHARDGRTISGTIRWGHDEERLWEVLDGRSGETEFDVRFASIARITPEGEGAAVELLDGRVFRLEGTDDVGPEHRGVFVQPMEGRARRLIRWADVERVEFVR